MGWKSSTFNSHIYNRETGILIPLFNEGLVTAIPQLLLNHHISKEDLSERIRLFYVALTRARESMIFFIEESDDPYMTEINDETIIDYSIRRTFKSYYDIVSSIKHHFRNKTRNEDE